MTFSKGTKLPEVIDANESALKLRAQRIERRGRCLLAPALRACWRLRALHPLIYRLLCALEGGVMFSETVRAILSEQYQVNIGMYSYGSCMRPGFLPPGTRIGNYCSIADGLTIFRRNQRSEDSR
jgi:hypothetical protein